MATADRPRLSGWWFLLPAGVLLAGWAVAAVVDVVGSIGGVVETTERLGDLRRVPVGEEAVVDLHEAGGWTVYWEGVGARDGRHPPLTVTVTPAGEGGGLGLRPYDGDYTYDVNGLEGVAIYTVDVPRPGRYLVSSTARGEPSETVGSITLGQGVTVDEFIEAGIAVLIIGGVSTLAALILLAVVAVKRGGPRPPPGWRPPPTAWMR